MADQAMILNGLAGLLQGFRQGQAQVRADKMEQLKEARQAQTQDVQNEYYKALTGKMQTENTLPMDASQYVAGQLGMETPTIPLNYRAATAMANAYKVSNDVASQIRLNKLQQQLTKKQEKDADFDKKQFLDTYKATQKAYNDLQAKTLTLMNDPARVEENKVVLNKLKQQLDYMHQIASPQYGINFLTPPDMPDVSTTGAPAVPTMVPTPQPGLNWKSLGRAMGF